MQILPKLVSTRGYGRWLGAVLALAMIAAVPVAQAAPVQFAQFQQTAGAPFTFTNGSPVSTFTLAPPAVQVTFNFLAPSGQSTADRAATMTFNAQTNLAAATLGPLVDQPINGPANTITFTENSTGKNLLTMIFTGDIVGFLGSPNGQLSGSTNDGVGGNKVFYSSDYLAFGAPGTQGAASYLIGLPTIGPVLSVNANGFLNSFTSAALGSFSSGIAFVPEPASVVMLGTAVVPLVFLAGRRKRLAKVTATAAA